MARLKYGDRVRESTTTVGSGDYALEGVTDPLERTFVQGIGDQEFCYYCCESTTDWEIGYGQIIDGGTPTLTRTTILASSNNDLKVPWAVGTKTIFNTATAAALDHIAGFAINNSNVSFNRVKRVATASQTSFNFIYLVGSIQVFVDGALIQESEYTANDGATVVFNTGLTAGAVVEFYAIGQYTTTHNELSTPVPTGQLFKSGMFFNNVWRNDAGSADAIAIDCTRTDSVSGIDGDAVVLDGVTSAVNLTDFGLDHSADFTTAFWIKTASVLADATLLSNQSVSDVDGYLHIRTTAAGNLVVAVLDGSDVEQTITKAIVANTTYHVVVTHGAGALTLWVDGVKETPLTTTVKTTTPTNDLSIGGRLYPTPSEYCEATVYGVNIYDSLLTDLQIADVYSEPNAPAVTDLGAVVVPGGVVATNDDIIAMVIALG